MPEEPPGGDERRAERGLGSSGRSGHGRGSAAAPVTGARSRCPAAAGRYSHGEVVHEALPSRGPLQEVVDPALDAAAAQQGLAEAVDGDARVQADGGPRAVGAHHQHLAPQARRPLPLGRGAASRGRLPALRGRQRGVVGVRGALGQLQRRQLLAGRHAASPGQREPAQAAALGLARRGAGGHGWGGAAVPRELRAAPGAPSRRRHRWPGPRGAAPAGKGAGKRGRARRSPGAARREALPATAAPPARHRPEHPRAASKVSLSSLLTFACSTCACHRYGCVQAASRLCEELPGQRAASSLPATQKPSRPSCLVGHSGVSQNCGIGWLEMLGYNPLLQI